MSTGAMTPPTQGAVAEAKRVGRSGYFVGGLLIVVGPSPPTNVVKTSIYASSRESTRHGRKAVMVASFHVDQSSDYRFMSTSLQSGDALGVGFGKKFNTLVSHVDEEDGQNPLDASITATRIGSGGKMAWTQPFLRSSVLNSRPTPTTWVSC